MTTLDPRSPSLDALLIVPFGSSFRLIGLRHSTLRYILTCYMTTLDPRSPSLDALLIVPIGSSFRLIGLRHSTFRYILTNSLTSLPTYIHIYKVVHFSTLYFSSQNSRHALEFHNTRNVPDCSCEHLVPVDHGCNTWHWIACESS